MYQHATNIQTYLWVLPKSFYWMMSFCCPFSATPSIVQTSVPNTVQFNLVISKSVSGSSLQICTQVITSQNHIWTESYKEILFLDFHRSSKSKTCNGYLDALCHDVDKLKKTSFSSSKIAHLKFSLALYYCIYLAQYYNSTKLETYNLMCEGYKRDREGKKKIKSWNAYMNAARLV
jgi:hypothetical protein